MTALNEVLNAEKIAGDRIIACSEKKRHFAEGVNFYKLFWISTMGSILGYIVETFWCLLRNGHYECRSSLVFGPFNLIYGIGALVLYLGLHKINSNSHVRIFVFGMAAGTVVEYICSLVQEIAFGTASWNYSRVPFNIGGRICLPYSLFWGGIALLWVYYLLPLFENVIAKIPNSIGRHLTWILLVLLFLDAVITIAAVVRWTTRIQGSPAVDVVSMFLDRLFPDVRMESIFANMKFLN